MKVVWKEIVGFDGKYEISNEGLISVRGQEMKRQKQRHGYYSVRLWKNGVPKHYYVHRIVASHFLPNPENKRTVNHKDGNRLNNDVRNLEWATQSENIKHGYDNGNSPWNKGNYRLYEKDCPNCKEGFKCHRKNQIYCSVKCSNAHRLYLKKEGLL